MYIDYHLKLPFRITLFFFFNGKCNKSNSKNWDYNKLLFGFWKSKPFPEESPSRWFSWTIRDEKNIVCIDHFNYGK